MDCRTAQGKCSRFPELGQVDDGVCDECRGKGLGDCKHMRRTTLRAEGCGCWFVECLNMECPADIGQLDRYCTPKHCSFFEQS